MSTEVNGETMLMSIDSGKYYGLDPVGSEVWRRLRSPVSIAAVCQSLRELFDGDAAVVERDVIALISRLRDEGLVDVVG